MARRFVDTRTPPNLDHDGLARVLARARTQFNDSERAVTTLTEASDRMQQRREARRAEIRKQFRQGS